MKRTHKLFALILFLTVVSTAISLPSNFPLSFKFFGREKNINLRAPKIDTTLFGRNLKQEFELKKGLDIQGGMQVVLQADMSEVPELQRLEALESAKQVILRRVDLYGVNEPVVQTAVSGEDYRIVVELAGVDNTGEALDLVGRTAQLEFALISRPSLDEETASVSNLIKPTELSGKQLKRSLVSFDPDTGAPTVSIEFDAQGRDIFAQLTTDHKGEQLAIILDGSILMAPVINTPILSGQAVITGGFSLAQAQQLAIQLNAGALPVPIDIVGQRTVGASLGQESVRDSVQAGVIGILLVGVFMITIYGIKGVLATLALGIYSVITIAIYKIFGVTLTLPGIAGLLLSIGMAVDANILIFERMKEEQRRGHRFNRALELGFGRAWDSIKDANVATILTTLVLINPLNLPFLNTSGLVRGFGITLLIGVLVGLFTGVVVTRTLMRLFLKPTDKIT